MSREESIQLLESQEFDLLIIGGGITGVGIALDAQLRGLSVALIEKSDFASGTSSKSTKLIHGGLRYLKQFQFRMVAKVGRERAILHNNAPHLVHPEGMLLPIRKEGSLGWHSTRIALWIYDLLAGVSGDDRFKMLGRNAAIKKEPLLDEGIQGAGLYSEFRTDDARLVLAVAMTAENEGAVMANYVSCEDLLVRENHVSGVVAKDVAGQREFMVRARQVVNAAGPWVDDVRELEEGVISKKLKLTKGVHIVVDQQHFPVKQSIYFDTTDGRMIFAIPRSDKVYLGTTDTFFGGNKDEVRASANDIDYILEQANTAFQEVNLTTENVEASWAGLRPLIREDGKEPGELSRKDELYVSPIGLISIAGGKLTGYRLMARRVVDRVMKNLGRRKVRCTTEVQTLAGGEFDDYQGLLRFIETVAGVYKLPRSVSRYLCQNYGSKATDLMENYYHDHGDEDYNLVLAELMYCLDYEHVMTGLDFFERRTGRLFFNVDSVRKFYKPLLDVMAQKLDWDEARCVHEKEKIHTKLSSYQGISTRS